MHNTNTVDAGHAKIITIEMGNSINCEKKFVRGDKFKQTDIIFNYRELVNKIKHFKFLKCN